MTFGGGVGIASPPNSIPRQARMKKILNRLEHFEEWVLAYTLLLVVLMSFVQVVLRYGFHYDFTWFNEFARYTCIFMTFLGASIAVKTGAHFSMDALVQAMPGRMAHLAKVIVNLGCALFCLVVVYYGTVHCLKLHRFGVRTSAMRIPMYIPYLPIPAFSATMGMRFFGKMLFHLKAFISNEPFQS